MAGRYATALFELAREEGSIDRVKVDLDRFEALVDEVADLARLLRSPVFSAEEQPSERHLAAIKEALTAVTKKHVEIKLKVEPSIIGGLVVKLGSRMVDSSLRTKLNAMKVAMKEAH